MAENNFFLNVFALLTKISRTLPYRYQQFLQAPLKRLKDAHGLPAPNYMRQY